jgi:hypothetical protein
MRGDKKMLLEREILWNAAERKEAVTLAEAARKDARQV